MKRCAIFLSLLLMAASVAAEGTVDFADVAKLLDRQPAVKEMIITTFEVRPTGIATRIGTNVNPKLGGARVGPFAFEAKKKESKGGYDLEVVLCTTTTFLDAKRRPAPIEKAVAFDEKLQYVAVRQIPDPYEAADCGSVVEE